MKDKRQGVEFKDYSGGLITIGSLVGTDTKYSPDCLNVYSEGGNLRPRDGTTKLNSSAVGTSPNGNGIFNWVLSQTQQYIIGIFGTTVQKMSTNGNMWSGTFASVGRDATNGTLISDAITSFVIYSGNLIFTTEARNKPQVITTTSTSYTNVEFGGTGTSPQCKYLQVWKTHLWMLNIGAGGQLNEECDSISGWSDNDVNTGASTQSTFQGLSTFRLLAGGTTGHHARRTKTITATSYYSLEMKTYFAALKATADGDYASLDFANGAIKFQSRWSTNGLEINNGSAWLEVGVNIVTTGAWAVWKFLVTAGTATAATVDIFKDGSAVGLQYSCANASTASSGQIDIQALAGGSGTACDWYMDYMYINSITPRSYYYTDSGFESWVSASVASYTDTVIPTTPFMHYKCNNSASNSTVTDNGTGASDGNLYANATTLDTSVVSVVGKVNSAFTFDSSSSHHIRVAAATLSTISADAVGSLIFWMNPTANQGSGSDNSVFSFSSGGGTNRFHCRNSDNLRFLSVGTGGTIDGNVPAGSVSTGSWAHVAFVQDGVGIKIYVNGSSQTITYNNGTGLSTWLSAIGGLDSMRMGDWRLQGAEDYFYNGKFDDIRYYRTALSSSEILSIYAEGGGNEGHPTTVREGTTFYQGTFAYRVNNDGRYAVVSQTMASGSGLAGNAAIFGIWANVTNLATYKLRIDDGTSTYDTSVLTGNGTWQYQTLNFTPVSGAGTVKAQMILTSSAATAIFDMASVTPLTVEVASDLSDRLQRTAVGSYNNFSGTDSGNNDITTPGDVGLTGSAILNDKMYVFKKWSIHRVTYTGSTPLLDIKQSKSTVGTASPRTIRNVDIPGRGEVLIFLGTDRRIYIFDGYEATAISDNISINNGISSFYLKNINTQALDKCHAAYHSDFGWYELFVPIDSSTTPDYSLLVVINDKSFSFFPYNNRNFLSSAVSDNGSGQRVIYALHNTNGFGYLLNSTTSDAGSAINAYWTSFKIGSPVLLGRMDEIEVQTDNINCTPTFSWRMNWETNYINKTLSANSYSHNFDPGRINNLAQFKIASNTTGLGFKLWTIGLYERIVGGGK